MSNLSELVGGGGGGGVDFQEFTSSGTWTKPAGATFVKVEVWGAGGGGEGQIPASPPVSFAGGGGGAYMTRTFKADDLGSTAPVIVGAGGAGGDGLPATAGADGGYSSFGPFALVKAYGGYGAAGGEYGKGGRAWGELNPGAGVNNTDLIEETLTIAVDPPGPANISIAYIGILTGAQNSNPAYGYGGVSLYGGGVGGGNEPSVTHLRNGGGSVYGGGGGGFGSPYIRGQGGSQKYVRGGNPNTGTGLGAGGGGSSGFEPGFNGSYAGGGGGGTGGFAGGNGGPGLVRVYTW